MMRRTIPLIATLAAMLAAAVPAGANVTDQIARDCQRSSTGELRGTYTKAQLRQALHNLPSDVSEYSDCYDQIRTALRGNQGGDSNDGGGSGQGGGGTTGGPIASGGSGGGAGDPTQGGSAATPPGPPHVGTKQTVEVGGAAVQPGTIPALGQDAHKLPTPLLVFLLLLALGSLAAPTTLIVRRVIARRRA